MGWNSKPHWKGDFTRDTMDLAGRECYEDWNTDIEKHRVEVRNGVARLKLSTPYGLSGVVTNRSLYCKSPVPSSKFKTSTDYRNKWTAVADFYTKEAYDDEGCHNAVFIRVHNNRTYRDPETGNDKKGATRFGCFLRGEPLGGKQGCLQLFGDKSGTDPLEQGEYRQFFLLSEDPFDHPDDKYRVQIIEDEYRHPSTGWTLRWIGEIWNLSQDRRIGQSQRVTETTLKDDHSIVIPKLRDSQLAFALGPGVGGRCDVDLVATNYWRY